MTESERPALAVPLGAAGLFIPAECAGELAMALAVFRDQLLGRRPPAEVRQPRMTQRLVDLAAVAAQVAAEHERAKHQAAARFFAAEGSRPASLSAPAQITGPSQSATITAQQAADLLGLTVQHVRYLASTGRIRGQRTERNVWLLERASVVAYRTRRRERSSGRDDGTDAGTAGHDQSAGAGAGAGREAA